MIHDTYDDRKLHNREQHADPAREGRRDRHPDSHDTRGHFHPPPAATTPGNDASWPAGHRDVVAFVLDEIEDPIATLWSD